MSTTRPSAACRGRSWRNDVGFAWLVWLAFPRSFFISMTGPLLARSSPPPRATPKSRELAQATMALGSEHSPLLVDDAPEEGASRTSMRRALRFAGASSRFLNTHPPRSPSGDTKPSRRVSGSAPRRKKPRMSWAHESTGGRCAFRANATWKPSTLVGSAARS